MIQNIKSTRQKPDYEFKAKLIKEGKVQYYKDYQFFYYCCMKNLANEVSKLNIPSIVQNYESLTDAEMNECSKINKANYRRYLRCSSRISNMILLKDDIKGARLMFVTPQFDNKCLENTNEETRRKYLRDFLNEIAIDYVFNIDIGKRNEREHYHAVVLTTKLISNTRWKEITKSNSQINFEKLNTDKKSIKKIASYMNKINNLALVKQKKQINHGYKRLPKDIQDRIEYLKNSEF